MISYLAYENKLFVVKLFVTAVTKVTTSGNYDLFCYNYAIQN